MPRKTVCYGERVKKSIFPFGNSHGAILHFGILCTMKSLFFVCLMFAQDNIMSFLSDEVLTSTYAL